MKSRRSRVDSRRPEVIGSSRVKYRGLIDDPIFSGGRPSTVDRRLRAKQCAARFGINGDVARLKKAGDDHHSLRSRRQNALKIFQLDAADAENGPIGYSRVRLRDFLEADGFVVGFRRRGENRTEAKVIRALVAGGAGLLETVRGSGRPTIPVPPSPGRR